MSDETPAPFHKNVGKTYPVVGEIRVRRTNNVELFDASGTRYPRPKCEERLAIAIERDKVEVAYAYVPLPPAPDPEQRLSAQPMMRHSVRRWPS